MPANPKPFEAVGLSVIVSPHGHVVIQFCRATEDDAWGAYSDWMDETPEWLKANGWRCVRARLVPVEGGENE